MTLEPVEAEVDEAILSSLVAAANRTQGYYGEDETPVIVTKAVVVYQYVDTEGNVDWAYRRVGADWFEVGGAATMLSCALATAWDDEEKGRS